MECKNQHVRDTSGQLNFLSPKNHVCREPSAERLREVSGFIPQGMFSVGAGEQEVVIKQFAHLPNSHIETLVAYYKKGLMSGGIKTGSLGPGVAGVTRLVKQSSQAYFLPTSIVLAPQKGAFAFLHEVGHALEDTLKADVAGKNGDFNQTINAIYQNVRGSAEARSYAKTSIKEAFAETYANFYCSEATRAEMDRIVGAATVRALNQQMEKPYWMIEQEEPPPSLSNQSQASAQAKDREKERVPQVNSPVKIALHDNGDKVYLYVSFLGSSQSASICLGSDCREVGSAQAVNGMDFYPGYDVSGLIGSTISMQVQSGSNIYRRTIQLQRRSR